MRNIILHFRSAWFDTNLHYKQQIVPKIDPISLLILTVISFLIKIFDITIQMKLKNNQ